MFESVVLFLASVAVPNPDLTPGSFCTPDDPDFLEYRYAEHVPVCFRNVSTNRKDNLMRDYGLPVKTRYLYEIDHCIPLSLGGSNHNDNLWPQPRDEYNSVAKNKLVSYLFSGLNHGAITYEYALSEIRKWCPDPN